MTTPEKRGASTARRRLRYRLQGRQIVALTVVWLILVGSVSLVTVLGGMLVAWLVTILFPLPPIHYHGRLRPVGLLRLAAYLVVDLARSSVRLALYAFGRTLPRPGIVRVRLRSRSDLYQVNTAELSSVVPGTIVIDARRSTRDLYLHVFDLVRDTTPEEVVADTLALERRVVHAFGSDAERAALDASQELAARTEGDR